MRIKIKPFEDCWVLQTEMLLCLLAKSPLEPHWDREKAFLLLQSGSLLFPDFISAFKEKILLAYICWVLPNSSSVTLYRGYGESAAYPRKQQVQGVNTLWQGHYIHTLIHNQRKSNLEKACSIAIPPTGMFFGRWEETRESEGILRRHVVKMWKATQTVTWAQDQPGDPGAVRWPFVLLSRYDVSQSKLKNVKKLKRPADMDSCKS